MIRPIERQDREPLLALLQATGNFTAAEVAIAAELIDIVINKPDQDDYHGFVHDREPGAGGLLILGPVPATTGSWHMYWIAVHPDLQGSGIAQRLDQWAESFVRSRAGYWLLAETSGQPSYERTRGFYRKQGYQEMARIPDYYKPSDDLVIFGKRLNS